MEKITLIGDYSKTYF